MKVIIGVDPHKASHTAVAIDPSEDELSRLRIRSRAWVRSEDAHAPRGAR